MAPRSSSPPLTSTSPRQSRTSRLRNRLDREGGLCDREQAGAARGEVDEPEALVTAAPDIRDDGRSGNGSPAYSEADANRGASDDSCDGAEWREAWAADMRPTGSVWIRCAIASLRTVTATRSRQAVQIEPSTNKVGGMGQTQGIPRERGRLLRWLWLHEKAPGQRPS